MLYVMLLSMLVVLPSTLSVIKYLICGYNKSWLLRLNPTHETLWIGKGSSLLIPKLKNISLFCLIGLITLDIEMLLMWKWMGLFLKKKNFFKIIELSFPNWIVPLTLSLLLKYLQENWGLDSLHDVFLKLLFISMTLPYAMAMYQRST